MREGMADMSWLEFFVKEASTFHIKTFFFLNVATTLFHTYSPVRSYYFTKSVQFQSTTVQSLQIKEEKGKWGFVSFFFFFLERSGLMGF